MAKMMSPNTRIDWYPESGFVDPAAPTLAELNGGTNISCAIVTGYTLGFTDSDTDDSKTICDEGNRQNRGFANYEATLNFFRDAIGDAPTVFSEARDIFKDGRVTGWLAVRHGKKSTVAYEAGDVYSLFKVTSEFERVISADGGGPIQVEYPFLPQGEAYSNATAPAAGV